MLIGRERQASVEAARQPCLPSVTRCSLKRWSLFHEMRPVQFVKPTDPNPPSAVVACPWGSFLVHRRGKRRLRPSRRQCRSELAACGRGTPGGWPRRSYRRASYGRPMLGRGVFWQCQVGGHQIGAFAREQPGDSGTYASGGTGDDGGGSGELSCAVQVRHLPRCLRSLTPRQRSARRASAGCHSFAVAAVQQRFPLDRRVTCAVHSC